MWQRLKQKVFSIATYLKPTYKSLRNSFRGTHSNGKNLNVIDDVITDAFFASIRRGLGFVYGDDATKHDLTINKDYARGGQQAGFLQILNYKELRVLNPCHLLNTVCSLLKYGLLEIADARRRTVTKSAAVVAKKSSTGEKIWKGFVMLIAAIVEPFVYIPLKIAGDLIDVVLLDRLSDLVNCFICRNKTAVIKQPVVIREISESSESSYKTTARVIGAPSVRVAVQNQRSSQWQPRPTLTELALPGAAASYLVAPPAAINEPNTTRMTNTSDRYVGQALSARGQRPAQQPVATGSPHLLDQARALQRGIAASHLRTLQQRTQLSSASAPASAHATPDIQLSAATVLGASEREAEVARLSLRELTARA